jgi:hypothetical protein
VSFPARGLLATSNALFYGSGTCGDTVRSFLCAKAQKFEVTFAAALMLLTMIFVSASFTTNVYGGLRASATLHFNLMHSVLRTTLRWVLALTPDCFFFLTDLY